MHQIHGGGFRLWQSKKGGKKQRNKQEVGKCDISSISERPFIEILASYDCYNFTSTCYQV